MSSNLPSVPSIPGGIDPQIAAVLSAMKSNIEALHNGTADTPYATKAQLEAGISGLVDLLPPDAPSLEPPVALNNLVVVGGVLFNMLTWGVLPGNIDHIKIYRAGRDDRTVAHIVGTTQYCIWADYIPDGVDTKFYYWIRAVSKAGVLGSWNLVNGKVSTAGTCAAPLGIGDEQVSQITAAKIFCLDLAALNANLGKVRSGKMVSYDGMFQVNLTDKYIIVGSGTALPPGVSAAGWWGNRYLAISSGDVVNYEWTGSKYVESKSLRTIETGVAPNNTTVVLNRFYRTQPSIIVSPNTLQSYSYLKAAVDQTLQLSAVDIKETSPGSGSWSFRVLAQLVLAGGTNTQAPNENSGTIPAAEINSALHVTPPDTVALSVAIALTSYRGTGTAPNFYKRIAYYTLYARPAGAGAFSPVASYSLGIGPTLSAVNATLAANFGYAATWEFYVHVSYADLDGSAFASGAGGYNYAPDVTLALAADTAVTSITSNGAEQTASPSFTLPAFTATPGYDVYDVTYTASYGYYLYAVCNAFGAPTPAAIAQLSGLINKYISVDAMQGSVNADGTKDVPAPMGAISSGSTGYSPTVGGFVRLSARGSSPGGNATAQFKIFAAGTQAVIKQRQVITNATTPANGLVLGSYTSTITGATTLASGTLNYTAIL